MNRAVKKGELFTIDTGEYSDRNTIGLFKALKDIDFRTQAIAFAEQDKRVLVTDESDQVLEIVKSIFGEGVEAFNVADLFVEHLEKEGLIKETDYEQINLGDGYFDITV